MDAVKLFSIITINLNSGKLITRTIESVLAQKRQLFQYIVIDGKSDDESLGLIKQFTAQIDVFVSEKDNGIYDAMNKGLKHAKGKYVLFLNAGDYLHTPKLLEKLQAQNWNSAIVTGRLEMVENNRRFTYYVPFADAFALSVHTLPHPATFVRADVMQQLEYFDTNFRIAGDYELFVKAIHKSKLSVSHIEDTISVFFKDGVSSSNLTLLHEERKRIHNTYYGSTVPFFQLIHHIRMKLFRLQQFWKFSMYPAIYKKIKQL